MKAICLFTLPILLMASFSVFSQSNNYSNEFGLKSDNDSYLAMGQDRYYTNGLFLTYRHAVKHDNTGKKYVKQIWEAEIGQKMYNAQSGRITNIRNVDRPFAAYLYAGGKLDLFLKNEQLIQGSVQAGVMGPQALGRQAQELLHKTFGFYQIEGWQYQVNNQFEINSRLEYTSLLKRSASAKADINFNAYANAGTTFSGAGVGTIIRLGKLNNLSSSVSTNSRISNSVSDSIPAAEFFFYTQPMFHLVAYDATVSGGLFNADKGPVVYHTKPLVVSQTLGMMYARNRWTLDFSIIFKTRELKSPAKPHQYGSLSAAYKFN